MVHFGFSYIGLIFIFMLLVPNIIWTKNKPQDYDKYIVNENKILLAFERVGETLAFVACLIFTDFNIRPFTLWSLWLIFAFLCMILYEIYWIRYFISQKTMADMYSGILGVPVAGATLPCIAFFSLGIYGSNIFLTVSSLILSVGHIGIHIMHRNEVVEKKKTKAIVKILRVLILIPVAAFLATTLVSIAGRNINWFKNYIDTSKGINEAGYISIGGQDQYVVIRGKNINNPVILYIHGGPAGPDSPLASVFTDPLIDDYTVVCWDQRGCGRTYFKNADKDPQNTTVNFETALSDVNELVEYLCERFNTEKVILIGHSYGTIVGTRYVQTHPEKVEAYIGIGQFVCMEKSNSLAFEDAVSVATSRGESTAALEEARNAYQESYSLKDYMRLRNETAKYHPARDNANTVMLAFFSPYTGIDDIRWLFKQKNMENYQELERSLFEVVFEFDIYDYDLTYNVPMFFISGEMDYTCNSSLAKQFCDDIYAPQKEFVSVDGGGHAPQYATPEFYGDTVKRMLNGIG